MLYSFIKYIKDIKYVLNKFYIERVIYDIKYDGLKSINDIKKIYKNKYNYIDGVSETHVLKNKFDLTY